MFPKGFKTWIHNWKKNNWKSSTGNDVKNAGIIRCISAHLDIRGKMGQKVVLEYVKGHSGDTGNDGADLMANHGAIKHQVDERPWEQIAEQLDRQLQETHSDPHTPVAELTVLAPDNRAEGDTDAKLSESPAKMQKLSATAWTPSSSTKSKVVAVESPSKARSHSTLATNQASSLSKIPPLLPPTSGVFQSISSPTSVAKGKSKLPSSQEGSAVTSENFKASSPPANSTIVSYPHLSGVKSPMRVLCAIPPLVPVSVDDVNLDVSCTSFTHSLLLK